MVISTNAAPGHKIQGYEHHEKSDNKSYKDQLLTLECIITVKDTET